MNLRAERTTFTSDFPSARNAVCLCTCVSRETQSPWFLAWALANGDLLLKVV